MTDNLTFDALVREYTLTCGSCPSQYEGILRTGEKFYFRYRWACAKLGIGHTDDAAVRDSLRHTGVEYGEHWADGVVSEDEFKDLFVECYRAIKDRPGRSGEDLVHVLRHDLLVAWAWANEAIHELPEDLRPDHWHKVIESMEHIREVVGYDPIIVDTTQRD